VARQHVFPVCSVKFQKLDGFDFDESVATPITAFYNAYKSVDSAESVSVVAVRNATNRASAVTFIVEGGGEYLIDGDLSIPSETSFDWSQPVPINVFPAQIFFSYNSAPGSFNFNIFEASGLSPEEATPGTIYCIGSKPQTGTTLSRNLIPALDGQGFSPFHPANQYDMIITGDTMSGICWTTVMWSGNHFVYLGSSNWATL